MASSPSPTTVVRTFTQWLGVKRQAAQVGERQSELRGRLLDLVTELGEEDDRGNVVFELPKVVDATDEKGRTHLWRAIKRERHLTPANPLPDAEKAIALLRSKDLWISEKDLTALTRIEDRNRFVKVHVEVDVDAVAEAYFRNQISEAEYESILEEQRESWQLRPVE